MRSLTCIVCPIGCALSVEESPAVGAAPATVGAGITATGSASAIVGAMSAPGSAASAPGGATPAIAGATPAIAGAASGEAELTVAGNRCPRGAVYAQEEVRSPKRVVTATCRLGSTRPSDPRRLPVKTTVPCPKERIGELLSDIYALRIEVPVEAGQVLIVDWKGTGLDVAAARGVR